MQQIKVFIYVICFFLDNAPTQIVTGLMLGVSFLKTLTIESEGTGGWVKKVFAQMYSWRYVGPVMGKWVVLCFVLGGGIYMHVSYQVVSL